MPYKDPEDQKVAARKHYDANKASYKERAKKHRLRVSKLVTALMRDRKSVPCKDCGKSYPPYVMDFDHRDGEEKLGNVGSANTYGWSLKTVAAEIAKCDVVCSNCHRERTWGPAVSSGSGAVR